MNPRHYHTPLASPGTRPRCPVCHEAVYSTAGIHPQCAVRRSDPPKPKSGAAAIDPAASPATLPDQAPDEVGPAA